MRFLDGQTALAAEQDEIQAEVDMTESLRKLSADATAFCEVSMLSNPSAHLALPHDACDLESSRPCALGEDFLDDIANHMNPFNCAEHSADLHGPSRCVPSAVSCLERSEDAYIQGLQQPCQAPRHEHEPHVQSTCMVCER